jgi:hypothetical protein
MRRDRHPAGCYAREQSRRATGEKTKTSRVCVRGTRKTLRRSGASLNFSSQKCAIKRGRLPTPAQDSRGYNGIPHAHRRNARHASLAEEHHYCCIAATGLDVVVKLRSIRDALCLVGDELLASESGLSRLLTRLGLVAGCALAFIAASEIRHWLTTKPPTHSVSSTLTASDKPAAPALGLSAEKSAGSATPDMRARFDAGFAIQPSNNSDYDAAAKLMIPPPPQTELALQRVDPRRLRANFQRGMTAIQSDAEDQKVSGAHLVSVAAILGYGPARLLIAHRYPSSSTIRSAVASAEAVRYSLDSLMVSGVASEGNRNFLVLLAAYFSGHQALADYANNLLAVLLDDNRLQTGERLQLLLGLLARVRGSCTAVAMIVGKPRTATGSECSPALQAQIENYLHVTTPPGFEAESRRHSVKMLDNSADAERPVASTPASD